MTQPNFVPITEADQVRPALQLETPGHWVATRPAELRTPRRTPGRGTGVPGPDQGFALRLARSFLDRLHLAPGEEPEDVIVGCALLASKRAGGFGRAPCIYDVNVGFTIFGFLVEAPDELVLGRRVLFRSVAHDYAAQRDLVDLVNPEVLSLRPEAVEEWFTAGGWRQMVAGAPAATVG